MIKTKAECLNEEQITKELEWLDIEEAITRERMGATHISVGGIDCTMHHRPSVALEIAEHLNEIHVTREFLTSLLKQRRQQRYREERRKNRRLQTRLKPVRTKASPNKTKRTLPKNGTQKRPSRATYLFFLFVFMSVVVIVITQT